MNYEKAYKEALEKIREGLQPLPDGTKISGATRAFLEEVFPELQESEDERIRKALVRFHKSTIDVDGIKGEDIIAWLEKQGEKKAIMNVPTRELIFSIWDLGNEWKELTNGRISTEYGTQLDYIQKHWHESEYYLREKQGEQNSTLSDEDKMMLNELIIGFYGYKDQYPNFWKLRTDEIIEWLKKKKNEHTTDNG